MASSATRTRPLTGRTVFLILACFFGTIASADGFLIVSALRTWSGTEATSAYMAGQLYNSELALARSQETRGWNVTMAADPEPDGRVRVTARARDALGQVLSGRTVTARLQRPTDQRADRGVDFVEGEPGSYVAVVPDVAPGQWDLVVDVLEGGERAFRRRTRVVLR